MSAEQRNESPAAQDQREVVGYEVVVRFFPGSGTEVSRYDTRQEADDTVRWYGETYGRNLVVKEVKAGSGPVCLWRAES